jgi:hypothetical protein
MKATTLRHLRAIVVVTAALCSATKASAWAEAPVPGDNAEMRVNLREGIAFEGLATWDKDASDDNLQRLLGVRLATDTRTLGIEVGLAHSFARSGGLSLRVAGMGGPFVSFLDGPAPGVRASLLGEGVFEWGGLRGAIGPKLEPAVVWSRELQSRLGIVAVASLSYVGEAGFGLTLTTEGGYNIGGLGAGTMTGSISAGVVVPLWR